MSALNNRQFIESLLKQVDWAKAPAIIIINYGKTECVYLKQEEGYYGVPRTTFIPKRKDGKPADGPIVSSFGHMIYCRGENLGLVLPPITTNWLHEGRKKSVDKKDYHNYLFLALSTITQACMSQESVDMPALETLGAKLGFPWLSFHKNSSGDRGNLVDDTFGMSEDDKAALRMIPEVGQELLDFSEQTKTKITVDMVQYLGAPARRIDPSHVLIERGTWDEKSTQQAKICRLSAGVISACKLQGVRLSAVPVAVRQKAAEKNYAKKKAATA